MLSLSKRIIAVSLSVGLLLLASDVWAVAPAAVITHLSGTLTAKRSDGSVKLLAVKSEVQVGDVLTTEQETYARLKFTDGGEVVLRPGSSLKVDTYVFNEAKPEEGRSMFSLLKGGLRAVTGLIGKTNKENVGYATPTATIGIRGTNFGALFCQNDCGGIPTVSGQSPSNGLYVDVSQGAVIVSNPGGAQVFQSGQFGFVANLQTPPVVVPPNQGVPVTMPPSISQNSSTGHNLGAGQKNDVDCVVR